MEVEGEFRLERFLKAQEGVYEEALAELRRGRKEGHWMWFVFPQARGLGRSLMAQRYAIQSRREAEAYLAHPILGERLRVCARTLLALPLRPIAAILPPPDDLKLKSSMTLFWAVGGEEVFAAVLGRYFGGERCAATLAWLSGDNSAEGKREGERSKGVGEGVRVEGGEESHERER
ncbi:MAG: DUF1810 domain-containing protein [Hydrogenophilus sp.]|nr:DUF1810 domain-containing protein [Hydrogenophilus sp.]